ncbi:MAG: hypothetical protein R3F30_10855 [Planctomycetota bacterium]
MSMFGFLGKANPLRLGGAWLRRHPWLRRLLIALPILLVLALLEPVVGLVEKLLSLLERILGPLLDTAVGRAVLLVLVLLLLAFLVYAFARDRVLDLFRRHALSRHLRACEALLQAHHAEARRGFQAVLRLGRWFDLAKGPAAEHGDLAVDARLKLARMALEDEGPKRAHAILARVPRNRATGSLALSHAELSARVYAVHPGQLQASVLEVLAEAHETWPGHPGVAELYVERLLAQGRGEDAADVLGRTLRKARKSQGDRVRRRLAALELALARAALAAGDLAKARARLKRAGQHDETEELLLLRADLALAEGQVDVALRVLAEVESPLAKERIRRLLADGIVDARKLLASVPRLDALVALAEHYLAQGDLRRAGRALRACLREGEPSPRLFALWASFLAAERRLPEARRALMLALGSEVDPEASKDGGDPLSSPFPGPGWRNRQTR